MRRLFLVVLMSFYAVSLMIAGGRNQQDNSRAKLPMRYYMPGAPTADWETATRAINEALDRDGLNIDFQPRYIPWDQWVDKINLMISTGEEFELFHVMEDYVPTSTYASRRSLASLSSLLENDFPSLKQHYDPLLWQCVTINGEIYSVPAQWIDSSGDFDGDIRIRKDKYDQYNIPVPKTPAEIITALTALQQRWAAEDGVKRYFYEHSLSRPSLCLHRSYDTWPFFVSLEGIFQVRQDGTANLYFTTDEFKKDAEFMNTLYQAGLIHPDILNLPADTISINRNNGDLLMGFITGPRNTYELTSQGIDAEVLVYFLNPPPEKPMLTIMPVLNSNAIPITAKHPEAGLKFLDWMYKSQANQDLVLYGVQGRHWKPVGADRYELIRGPDATPLYKFDNWMIETIEYHRFDIEDRSSDLEKKDWLSNINPDNTEISPKVGFNFNSEPVRVEYANMMAEYTASILPIKVGVIPYAGNFEAAMVKMRAAGCDKVIAEYRKQLAAYISNK